MWRMFCSRARFCVLPARPRSSHLRVEASGHSECGGHVGALSVCCRQIRNAHRFSQIETLWTPNEFCGLPHFTPFDISAHITRRTDLHCIPCGRSRPAVLAQRYVLLDILRRKNTAHPCYRNRGIRALTPYLLRFYACSSTSSTFSVRRSCAWHGLVVSQLAFWIAALLYCFPLPCTFALCVSRLHGAQTEQPST
eukprot:6176943-Pleurochrysis_carterae.AAC.3